MDKPNPNALVVKITLLLSSSLTIMAGATIAPSLPAMQSYFSNVENAGYWVRLVLTVPALFIVIGGAISGLIIDRFGRKPLLVGSVLLYGFAGSSGFVLNSLFHLLVGRAFLGIAVAGIMTSVTTLIADYYSGQKQANFLGLQSAFIGFGGFLFLSLGGWLADLNWQFPFLIYLFAFTVLPLIVLFLFEPSHSTEKYKAFSDTEQLIAAKTPVKLLVFIYAIITVSQVIFYLIPVQLPFYLKALVNAKAAQSGMAIALCTMFSAFGSITYGRLKVHLKFISILSLAFGVMGIGYIIIGLASTYQQVLIGLAVGGVGLGWLIPNLTLWISAVSPSTVRGRALGGFTTFLFLGQFLSPNVAQLLSQKVGLGIIYCLAGGLLLVLTLVFLGMKRQIMALSATPLKQS